MSRNTRRSSKSMGRARKKSIEGEMRYDVEDAEVNPAHYKELSPEPLAVIESWGLPFHEAQVLKYLSRAGRKGGEGKRLVDLKKARTYLDRRIAQLERQKL